MSSEYNSQWYWNSAPDPWCGENEQWEMFKDDKNKIIENAYNARQAQVEIDDEFVLDLEYLLQYNKIDNSNSRQIKRVQLETNGNNFSLREERFSSPIPIVSARSLTQESDLDDEALEYLKLYGDFPDAYYEQEVVGKNKTFADIIDQAVEGIRKEGIYKCKEKEVQQLVGQLLAVRDFGTNIIVNRFNLPREIGETCVRLYTKNSFWFGLINSICRDPATISHEKIRTIGPFCYLLDLYLLKFGTDNIETAYRGLDLTDDQRLEYMKPEVIFKSFTSTSQDEAVAEMFMKNTLLVIDLNVKDPELDGNMRRGADISSLSQFSVEKEFLIWPSAEFTLVDYKYDTKKHIIHLKSSQKK